MFETHKATFEVYLEDTLIHKQTMQAPKEMLMMNFVQLYEQTKTDTRPIRVKMIVPMYIWHDYKNEQKVLDNGVEFLNNAMLSYQESKQQENKQEV